MSRKKSKTTLPDPITGPHLTIEATRVRRLLLGIIITIVICTVCAVVTLLWLR